MCLLGAGVGVGVSVPSICKQEGPIYKRELLQTGGNITSSNRVW
jgi:hypothetical protein